MLSLKTIITRFSKSETQTKVIKNLYWALIGKIVSLFSTLFIGIIVARYLGPEQYGLMNYVISFVSLFQIISTFGLENIEIREEARYPDKVDSYMGSAFVLRIMLSILTLVLVIGVSYLLESDSYVYSLVCLYAVTVVFSPSCVIRNYFTSIVLNEYVVKVTIACHILSFLIKLLLVLLSAPLSLFVGMLVWDAGLEAFGYYIAFRHYRGKSLKWLYDKELVSFLFKESFPLFLSGLSATIFVQIDQLMIGRMIDKEAVGYFSVASQLIAMLMFVPNILIQTISPILVQKKKEKVDYYAYAQRFMNFTIWGCILLSIIVSLSSKLIINCLYGIEYTGSIILLSIISFKLIGTALNVVSGQLLIIDNKQKLFIVRSSIGAVFCVVLNYFAIKNYGVLGCACVTVTTQFVAGWLIHLFIPQYRYMFKMQVDTLLYGWKDLKNVKLINK